METIKATLWIYRIAVKRSAQLMRENWAVVFAPFAYSVFLSVAGIFLIPFGLVGGLLLLLASNACMSSGLHLLENILNSRKADFNDFFKGFTVYLWEIVRIAFILWIPMMLVSSVLTPIPNGNIIVMFIQIALYIILNAVPELIYQSRASGIELLVASYYFIIENWPEWFAPNIIITFAGWVLMQALNPLASVLAAPLHLFIIASLIGFFLTYLMIFRGLLFSELNGSNRRARVYRYKARDST
ncbi:MAG: hypothetical protein V3S85_02145 [Nitrospirales bacterium]